MRRLEVYEVQQAGRSTLRGTVLAKRGAPAGRSEGASETGGGNSNQTISNYWGSSIELAANSTSMADSTEQLNELDAAGKAIDEQELV